MRRLTAVLGVWAEQRTRKIPTKLSTSGSRSPSFGASLRTVGFSIRCGCAWSIGQDQSMTEGRLRAPHRREGIGGAALLAEGRRRGAPNFCKEWPPGIASDGNETALRNTVWPQYLDDNVMNWECDVVGFPRLFSEHASGSSGPTNPQPRLRGSSRREDYLRRRVHDRPDRLHAGAHRHACGQADHRRQLPRGTRAPRAQESGCDAV
jgi:hypothetical protein